MDRTNMYLVFINFVSANIVIEFINLKLFDIRKCF